VLAACADKTLPPRQLAGADPNRGREIAERTGCGACHEIPGVPWPRGRVGGSLAGFGDRPMIAGHIPNQPDALVRWLQAPPSLAPATGMPPSGLTDVEARDVAAFLYTLQ
jgi:sulfur-oxidizing protein SoxX